MKNAKMTVTIALIAANIISFAAMDIIMGGYGSSKVLTIWGGGYVPLIKRGEYYRLFSSMFVHSDIRHLLNNMLLLFVMGAHLEKLLGSVKFLILYLAGGLAASYISYLYYLANHKAIVFVGASGAIFAVIGAMLNIAIRSRGQADGLSVRQIIIMLILSVYLGASTAGVSNIAHISGAVAGFILAALLYRAKKQGVSKPSFEQT